MTSVSKNVYIDKLDDIVNKCNDTYHRTIKMKLVNLSPKIYNDFNEKNNKGPLKFSVGDNIRISKYKICLQKVTLLIGLKKFLWFQK